MRSLVIGIACAALASCGGRSSSRPAELPTSQPPTASGASCLVSRGGEDLAPLGYARITPKLGVPCFGLFAHGADAERTSKLLAHDHPGLTVQALAAGESDALARTLPLFLGAPVRALGNDLSTARVVRAPDDVLMVIVQSQFEGEPSMAMVWLLDGQRANVYSHAAWAVAAAAGKAVYAKQHLVHEETEDPPVDSRDAVAAAIGVSRAEVDAATFHDGFAGNGYVAQPVLIDLATGVETALPIAGGGELAAHGGRFHARLKPWYWNQTRAASDPIAPAYRLDIAAGKLVALTGNDAADGALLFQDPRPPELLDWSSDAPRTIGDVAIATASRSVGLVIVNDARSVQPARLPPK